MQQSLRGGEGEQTEKIRALNNSYPNGAKKSTQNYSLSEKKKFIRTVYLAKTLLLRVKIP